MTTIDDIYNHTEERKQGKFTIRIKAELDDNPDLSYLGEYVGKLPNTDIYIDRQANVLFTGKEESKEKEFSSYDESSNFEDDLNENPACYDVDINDAMENGEKWVVTWVEREVLEVNGDYSRNEYRYWIPCNDENEPEHIIEDYDLHRKFGDSWFMVGIIVTASYKGVELGRSSLWGIDSTCDESETESIIKDCISEAVQEAEKKLDDLKKD